VVVLGLSDSAVGEGFTSSRIVEVLMSLLDQARPSSRASSQSSERTLG
jgi:hypothetical protein